MEETMVVKASSPRNPTTKDHGWVLLEDGAHLAASKAGPSWSPVITCPLENARGLVRFASAGVRVNWVVTVVSVIVSFECF
jgi:hypothetical protein